MNKKMIALVCCTVLVLCGALFLLLKNGKNEASSITKNEAGNETQDSAENSSEPADGQEDFLVVDGEKYEYNPDLKTILFLGIDKKGTDLATEFAGTGGQADCILLLVMNTKDQTTQIFQVSREIMADVEVYDISGNYLSTEQMQICLQYAYGDGGTKSNWLMKNLVSDIFYGLNISSCVAMDIDGLSAITKELGGIEITVPQDYTSIDSRFVQGTTLTLDEEMAEKYVRYRDINVTGSNNGRMERQTQFIRAMFSQMKTEMNSNAGVLDTIWTAAQPYMASDSSAEELKSLSQYSLDEEMLKVPGSSIEKDGHDQFVIDKDAFKQLYLDTFCQKAVE